MHLIDAQLTHARIRGCANFRIQTKGCQGGDSAQPTCTAKLLTRSPQNPWIFLYHLLCMHRWLREQCTWGHPAILKRCSHSKPWRPYQRTFSSTWGAHPTSRSWCSTERARKTKLWIKHVSFKMLWTRCVSVCVLWRECYGRCSLAPLI